MANTRPYSLPSHRRPSVSFGSRLGLLLWLSLSSSLMACDTQEVAALTKLQRELDLELAEKSEIAQNLNQRRRELDVLKEAMTPFCAPTTPEELPSRAESLIPGTRVTVRKREDPKVWLLVTRGGPVSEVASAVTSLARQPTFFSLEEVSAERSSWTLVLRSDGPCQPVPTEKPDTSVGSRSSLPPQGWFKTSQTSRLRESIAQTESRIGEIDKVIGVIKELNNQTQWSKQFLATHDKSQEGLRQQSSLVEALTAGPETFSGTLHLTGGQAMYEGPLTLGDQRWSARLAQAGFRASRGEGTRWVLAHD